MRRLLFIPFLSFLAGFLTVCAIGNLKSSHPDWNIVGSIGLMDVILIVVVLAGRRHAAKSGSCLGFSSKYWTFAPPITFLAGLVIVVLPGYGPRQASQPAAVPAVTPTAPPKQTAEEIREEYDDRRHGWIIWNIQCLRGLGFYPDLSGKSDEEVLAQINQRSKEEYHTLLDIGGMDALGVSRILHWDKQRVWDSNLKSAVRGAPKDNPYTNALNAWAAISRGKFSPSQIEEKWDAVVKDGVIKSFNGVEVSFVCNGSRHTLRPSFKDQQLDISILKQINELLEQPYQFRVDQMSSQYASVILLTDEQSKKLATDQQLKFKLP